MTFEKYEFLIPSFWLSALINGDCSALSEKETEQLGQFLEDITRELGVGHWSPGEDDGFYTYHDARSYGVLACDCTRTDYTVLKTA